MLSLDDTEWQILMRAAVPIRTDQRDQFLRALAIELTQTTCSAAGDAGDAGGMICA